MRHQATVYFINQNEAMSDISNNTKSKRLYSCMSEDKFRTKFAIKRTVVSCLTVTRPCPFSCNPILSSNIETAMSGPALSGILLYKYYSRKFKITA